MRSRTILVLCAFGLAGGLALAQDVEPFQPMVHVRAAVGAVPHAAGQDVVVMTFGGKAVAGKPYSADGVTEFTQKLANGTTISRKNTSSVSRDSQGRTRREQTINTIGPWIPEGEPAKIVTIFDPVTQETYTLNLRDKTARKMKAPPMPAHATAVASTPAEGPTEERKIMHIEKGVRVAGPGVVGMAAPAEQRFDVMIHRGPENVKTEDLGTTVMEGLPVKGTRLTSTIAAGEIGNDQPITTVTTRWYSPDLDTVVMSDTDDPLAGKTVYRLTNVNRSEPPSTLFQIPADYTVTEANEHPFRVPAGATIRHREVK